MLTPGRIANLLGVAPRTVAKWCDNGHLKSYRVPHSNHRRILHKDFVKFVEYTNLPITPKLREILQLEVPDEQEVSHKEPPKHRYDQIPLGSKFSFTPDAKEIWIKLQDNKAAEYKQAEFKRGSWSNQMIFSIRESSNNVEVYYLEN